MPLPEPLQNLLLNPPLPRELDALQLWLLVANAASLLVHVLHFALLRPHGRAIGEAALGLVTAAGGAAATMLAHLIWDRRTTKENAWQHVLALASLVLWGVAYAFTHVCPPQPDAFVRNLVALRELARPAGVLLAAASAVTLVAFGFDKWCAVKDRWRIPEAVLLGLCCFGGTLGGLLGMLLFRHKIRSTEFAWGVPLILVAQLALLAYLINAGMINAWAVSLGL